METQIRMNRRFHQLTALGVPVKAHLPNDDPRSAILRSARVFPDEPALSFLLEHSLLEERPVALHLNPELPYVAIAIGRRTNARQVFLHTDAATRARFLDNLAANDSNPKTGTTSLLVDDGQIENVLARHQPGATLVYGRLKERFPSPMLRADSVGRVLYLDGFEPGLDVRRELGRRGFVCVHRGEGSAASIYAPRETADLTPVVDALQRENVDLRRDLSAQQSLRSEMLKRINAAERTNDKLMRELGRAQDRIAHVYGSVSYKVGRQLTTALRTPAQTLAQAFRGRSAPEGRPGRSLTAGPSSGGGVVSVIMTTFRSRAFVDRAIESVLSQSYKNLELIIVDDASDDGTLDYVLERWENSPRVRAVGSLQNRGTYAAKNLGLTLAQGDFVTFQDSDDWSQRERLEVQVGALRRSAGALGSAVNYVRVNDDDKPIPGEDPAGKLGLISLMLRREALDHLGFFDSVRVGADAEYIDRLRAVFGPESLIHLRKPLYRALTRSDSLTTTPATAQTSAKRAEYQASYQDWHSLVAKGRAAPFVPSPLRKRPFPCPPSIELSAPELRQVAAGVASIPTREASLRRVVRALLPQVDRLFVALNGYAEVPAFLNSPQISVFRSQEVGDHKDNGKFLGLAETEDGVYLTVDDDLLYPDDYVSVLLRKLDQYAYASVVGVHGFDLAAPLDRFFEGREVIHFNESLTRDTFVDFLGTGTTAFHTGRFRPRWSDFGTAGMADVWLAIAAKRAEIPLIAVQREAGWLTDATGGDESLYTEFSRDDEVQTRAAREAAPWGVTGREAAVQHLAEALRGVSVRGLDTRGAPTELLEPMRR